jgi:membrane peptidoglycan carboxypeptidase
LNDHEAAQLAASLPYPTGWHPGVASRSYQRYVKTLLRRMSQARWINALL